MTEAQLIEWLKEQSAIRTILVEVEDVGVDGSPTTIYLSNKGYVTSPTDTPANTLYTPIITGGVDFTESVSVDSDNFSINYGDIELLNIDGSIDDWLDYYWEGRTINVFIGDVSWPRSDFYQIFSGLVASIDVRNRGTFNLKVADKLQRLNTPLSETKLGGTSSNADNLIPLCFGEVHNVTPLLVDSANHEYQVHVGAIEDIIEVRDNGVPVSITKYLSTGKFRLNQAPYGTITCSVQGHKPSTYSNTVATLIQQIVTTYGDSDKKFTTSDIDTDQLDTFNADNQQPVGYYTSDRVNVLSVCNDLAASVGARMVVGRDGKLRLVKIELPRADSGTTISSSDMVDRSLEIESLPAIVAGVQLGYCKNYTVQNNLQTGIPAAHIDLFAEEWLTITRTDTGTSANYKLFVEPEMQSTCLQTQADAIVEADRRLDLFSTRRKILKYKGYPHLLTEQLGDTQTLTHSRFGLSAGVAGQIVKIKTDWIALRVEISVLI